MSETLLLALVGVIGTSVGILFRGLFDAYLKRKDNDRSHLEILVHGLEQEVTRLNTDVTTLRTQIRRNEEDLLKLTKDNNDLRLWARTLVEQLIQAGEQPRRFKYWEEYFEGVNGNEDNSTNS